MKPRVYKPGTILLFEEGEYSDFGYVGQVVTLRELDIAAEIAAQRESLGKNEYGDMVADDHDHGPDVFVAHLVMIQAVAPLECETLGNYILDSRNGLG